MSAWSFEVKNGRLDMLPQTLVDIANEQRSLNVESFFLAEGGVLLNEPEEKLLASIPKHATPPQVIARLGHACSWLFDMLESEIDQNFRWNYLKISFVNLSPLDSREGSRSGKFTTNSPKMPRR